MWGILVALAVVAAGSYVVYKYRLRVSSLVQNIILIHVVFIREPIERMKCSCYLEWFVWDFCLIVQYRIPACCKWLLCYPLFLSALWFSGSVLLHVETFDALQNSILATWMAHAWVIENSHRFISSSNHVFLVRY